MIEKAWIHDGYTSDDCKVSKKYLSKPHEFFYNNKYSKNLIISKMKWDQTGECELGFLSFYKGNTIDNDI